MVFTQGRGFVGGTSFGLPCCSLRRRALVCHAADTASLATWFLFGKLFGVATLFGFGEKRCRKNLPLSARDQMNLLDVVAQLPELNADASIFATHIDGVLTNESPAKIVLLTQEEGDMSLDVVANKHCPGMVYLIDVDIARSIVDAVAGEDANAKVLALIAYVDSA